MSSVEQLESLTREHDFGGSDTDGTTVTFSTGEIYCWYPGPIQIGAVFRRKFFLSSDPGKEISVNFRILHRVSKREVNQRWSSVAMKPSHGPTSARGYWYLVHGD